MEFTLSALLLIMNIMDATPPLSKLLGFTALLFGIPIFVIWLFNTLGSNQSPTPQSQLITTTATSSASKPVTPCIFSTDLYCYFYLHTEETYPTVTQDAAMTDCRNRGGKLPTPYEIEIHRDQIAAHFPDPDFPMELWTDIQRYEVNERRQSRTMGLAVSIRPIPGEGYGNTLWVINESLPDASYACVRSLI